MDHSSARVSPHCHYPPAKAAPSMLSLTPFLTQHKAGRVPFRFHSARVGWPAFRRILFASRNRYATAAVSSGAVLVIGVITPAHHVLVS